MGSEGYLINQFIALRTNKRKDKWGGSYLNRIQFPIEIIKAIREEVGEQFIIIYRLSTLDLVKEGSIWDEVILLAQEIEKAGAHLLTQELAGMNHAFRPLLPWFHLGHLRSLAKH